MQKVCSQCNENKELENFAKQKTGKLGRRADCKSCVKRFRRSKKGLALSIFNQQKAKSIRRGYTQPTYTINELYQWLISQKLYEQLYAAWVSSEYATTLSPSCDRINDYKSYTLNNIRLTTAKQNTDRFYKDAKTGVNNKRNLAVDQLNLEGIFIKRFHSASEAARQFNGIPSNILGVCRKRVSTRKLPNGSTRKFISRKAYGYKWRYSLNLNENKEIICNE